MKLAIGVRQFRLVGGAERFMIRLVEYLKHRGHDLTVYAITGTPMDGVRLTLVPAPSFCPRWARDWETGKRIAEKLSEADADVTFGEQKIWNANVVRPGGGVEAVYWDYHLERKWRAKNLAPLVRSFYPKRHFDLQAERKSLLGPSLRSIIVNSDLVRRDMIRCYPATEEHIHVVHNGTSAPACPPEALALARSEIRRQLGLGDEACVALFIGHDFYRKGLSSAILSIARAFRKQPALDWHLLVAGRGHMEPYHLLAAKSGIGGRIHYMGDLQSTFPVYAASDALLFPSHYDPFANVTVEAIGHGLPVITTAENGGCEIIQNGHNGWVVGSPDNVDQMAECLVKLSDPSTLTRMKSNALASALHCKLEDRLRDIEQILIDAAGQKK